MTGEQGEQLALIRQEVKETKPTIQPPAPQLPVARITVDVPHPHLDRPFDYIVPAKYHESCVPGCRVKVRFAGQDLDGFVLERVERSEHEGRLMPLRRVVSAEPVLAPEIAELARQVADRYAGSRADVLRLAVPPRHARVENETPAERPELPPMEMPEAGGWTSYASGPEFLQALGRGDSPRAVWTALPAACIDDEGSWARSFAVAAAATLSSGRGALLIVPDQRDVNRLDQACKEVLGDGRHVALIAGLGPAERYRRFLAVRRKAVQVVIGTRAAAFAPVDNLGLVACWDDGDDLHSEPRAPYPHVRDVLLLRAHQSGAAALLGGYACTAECAQLLATGWARLLAASRTVMRTRVPRVRAVGETEAELARDPAARAVRLPHKAFEIARGALTTGPVLIQVPRAGYIPALACQSCRKAARCPACNGPLRIPGSGQLPACGWCGRVAGAWRCPACQGTRLRAPVIGSRRTAEELGRAFPRVPVRTSGGQRVLDTVGAEPTLVVATPGAEPVADKGYAAALILDSWIALSRADLRAEEETLRRWFATAALVRPGVEGGEVVVVGDPALLGVQALVRWSPLGFAERELAERRGAGFPPAVRLVSIEGPPDAVEDMVQVLRASRLPPSAELLGPVPLETRPTRASTGSASSGSAQSGSATAHGSDSDAALSVPVLHDVPSDEDETARLIVRSTRADGAALSAAVKAAQGVRSARKSRGATRVKVDPHELG